jgi:rod shape-determining protein MreC
LATGRKYYFLALLSGVTCILALYIHVHRQGRTTWIDNGIISVTGGFQSGFSSLGQGIKKTIDHYFLLVDAKKRSEELETEVNLLRSKVISQDEIVLENKRLQDQLSLKAKEKETFLSARVVAHDVSPDFLGIRIDRGSQDGVQLGMGVIHTSGVVGKVHRVTRFYSDVMTVLDPSSNIDVIVQRSRARGVLSGQSKQLSCKLKYIDRLDDVLVNDILVSTDFGRIFPKGMLVGTVTAVIPNSNGILQTVAVKSAIDIYRLEEVFLVFPPKQSEKVFN